MCIRDRFGIRRTKADQANSAAPDRFLVLPIQEERYQVMTENPFPYTSEVRAQLRDLVDRWHNAQVEQARLWEEDKIKYEAFQEEVKRKLEAKRQSGELDD